MILYSLYSQDIIVFSFFVFFFKQKTAYEMRISDWSSDVCSSDLESVVGRELNIPRGPRRAGDPAVLVASSGKARELLGRSEEHTSELQSLLRTSYAVFCLKNKNSHQLNLLHVHDARYAHSTTASPTITQ